MHLSLKMLSLPSLVYGNFFFCSHRAVFEADSFYIDSLYNSISGVLLICVTVSVKSCSRNFHAVQSSVK